MEGVGTTRPPELHIASRPKKPSDWTPRPIPQPGPERRTADPKTPTARELAERARQRASVVAKADATRVEKHAVATPPAASTPDVRPHRETALDRDPLGRDRLTAVEQRRLGELCQRGDCSPVQVDRGNGTPTANNLRADILTTRQGRSVTLGNRIVLADADTNDFAILAHDVQHTLQYQRWGAVAYYSRGLGERVSEMLGHDPYRYRVDGRSFDAYGMEQQGQIVQDYVRGFSSARSIPGVPKVGP